MLRRLFPSLAGAASAAPRALAHRPILKRDAERMRWAGDGGFVLPRDNPGVRVEAGFVSEAEAAGSSPEEFAERRRVERGDPPFSSGGCAVS